LLTQVEVRNSAGTVLTLPIGQSFGGYFLKGITGLDPVKATIVTSSYADRDGAEYESARRDIRNPVLSIGFDPDWVTQTPKTLRDNLYNWFMTKSQVELRFYEDSGLVVTIVGRVESNSAPRFTSDPDSTISVICPIPDFQGMTNNLISGTSVATGVESALTYVGTSETGFVLDVNVNRAISGFSMYARGVDGAQYELDFSASLVAGDIVEISTVIGNKYATLTRAGVQSSLLYGISPSSPWLTLQPGINNLRLLIPGAAIPYTIAYTDKYGAL
jgi:Phage tail protein